MMFHLRISALFLAILLANASSNAQQAAAESFVDSLNDSHLCKLSINVDSLSHKSTLNILVKEPGPQGSPIQGATVLLRRDKDKMFGRVSDLDGKCTFSATEAAYVIRVQLTGYKSLETDKIFIQKGNAYTLELCLAFN